MWPAYAQIYVLLILKSLVFHSFPTLTNYNRFSSAQIKSMLFLQAIFISVHITIKYIFI